MADHVFVQGLVLHGFHGVHAEETRLGQKFVLDIDCQVDIADAVAGDDYAQAVCYGGLCDVAVAISAQPCKLIETLASRIADAVLARYPTVSQVAVTVQKPSAPLPHPLRHVGARIERIRRTAIGFSFGSNIGDKVGYLRQALDRLAAKPGIEITAVSDFYRTAPWGLAEQDWFVNACAIGTTSLSPQALLKTCQALEVQIGRTREKRWGPRIIDIDLLYYGDVRLASDRLTLPHAELCRRAFVLVPLAEIAPDQGIGDRTVAAWLADLPRQAGDVVPLTEN